MRIINIDVSGFKSLRDFELTINDSFCCLIGLNGAGKSSLLQLLGFVAALASGTSLKWLEERSLEVSDLSSKPFAGSRVVDIRVIFILDDDSVNAPYYVWDISLQRTNLSLNYELFAVSEWSKEGKHEMRKIFSYGKTGYSFNDGQKLPSHLEVFGSMLANIAAQKEFSEINDDDLNAFRMLKTIRSFELLAPNLIKRNHKKNSGVDNIGVGGEYLGNFINNLSPSERSELVADVKKYYPSVMGIGAKVRRFGWVDLYVEELVDFTEKYQVKTQVPRSAKMLNDGLLRIVAILAQKYSKHNVILFDEIENGLNSEVLGKLVSALLSIGKQVIVTTHSPMLLNYIPEEIAKDSVHLIYRAKDGGSKQVPFFTIPSVQEKLDFLAPGDAMLDVRLEEVAVEAEQLSEIKRQEKKRIKKEKSDKK